MKRLVVGWRARAGLAAWLCLGTGAALAHAPTPRRVAVSRDGSAIALSLPGFGLLFRPTAEQPFVYVCDALLGQRPSELVPSLAFLADGSLLMASADGVRSLRPDGCPRADAVSELSTATVLALAVQPSAPETAYAVVAGSAAGLWQSRDGGKHWTLRSSLDASELTNVLVVSARDPDRVYLGLRGSAGSSLLASTDGGASWTKLPQEPGLILLSADGPAPYPLWAMARDALTVGNRGFAILRAQGPGGPWQQVLRINYFGGLTVDAQGVIWVGDEIGGIYRSEDGGDSFRNLEADADVACLTAAGEALWACTPGTPKEPALQRLERGEERSSVIALDAVDRLVSCPDRDVAQSCAAAWAEWQRDVRLLPSLGQDAGQPAPQATAEPARTDEAASGTEALDASAAEASAGEGDAGRAGQDASSPPRSAGGAGSDCSLASPSARPPQRLLGLSCCFALALAFFCRRR